jgi:glycosyltransferase involved in cell wall biosynthesis
VIFSFIVPVTRQTFLSRSLQSIAAQKGEFEVILVDDSGQGYAGKNLPEKLRSRAVVIENKANQGRKDPTITWNQGLQRASGDFVFLVGDDDFIDSDYLEAMTALVRKRPHHDLYRCRLRIVNGTGTVQDLGFRFTETETWDEFLYMRNRYLRPHSTVEYCAGRDKLLEVGGYASLPLALGSDDLTWLLMSLDRPIVSTNQTFGNWRISERSICGSEHNGALRQKAHLELFERERRIIEEREPPVIPRELLLHSLFYRFQGFLNNAGFKGRMRRFASYLLPSAFEKTIVSVYKRTKHQDPKPHFMPADE